MRSFPLYWQSTNGHLKKNSSNIKYLCFLLTWTTSHTQTQSTPLVLEPHSRSILLMFLTADHGCDVCLCFCAVFLASSKQESCRASRGAGSNLLLLQIGDISSLEHWSESYTHMLTGLTVLTAVDMVSGNKCMFSVLFLH